MSKFSSAAKFTCAAALVGASLSASAAEVDLGFLAPGIVPHSFGGSVGVGTFSDVFKFQLPANLGTGYSVLDFPTTVTIPNVGSFSFKTLFSSMALFSNPDGVLFNADDAPLTSVAVTNASTMSLTWGPTAGGNMYLVVNGVGTGTAGGLYSGAISVSPIPEPEAWAMMLIGAGLVGFRLRSRSKKAAANRFV